MDIFESLENLNVSEECFDDIMGIVESIVTSIKKKYPHPALIKDEKSADYKSAVEMLPHREKLLRKAVELRMKANSPFSSKYASKNDNGEERTRNRSAEVLFLQDKENSPRHFYNKSDEKAIADSRARNKAKQEKKR